MSDVDLASFSRAALCAALRRRMFLAAATLLEEGTGTAESVAAALPRSNRATVLRRAVADWFAGRFDAVRAVVTAPAGLVPVKLLCPVCGTVTGVTAERTVPAHLDRHGAPCTLGPGRSADECFAQPGRAEAPAVEVRRA